MDAILRPFGLYSGGPTWPGDIDYKLYVSGTGNYRDQVATIRPYKGNRDPSHKPKYYAEIKQYLLDQWNGELVNGREADDAVGCEAWRLKKTGCIVSTDKDLNMIPGYHYNWVKKSFSYITLDEANLFFYRQLLTGDATDNVVGVPGVGPKTAEKLLPQGRENDLEYVAKTIQCEYEREYGLKWREALIENAKLLWIERQEGVGPPLENLICQ